ncbi:MAG: LysM peptidoglycan-binding domain-containing M23 family metallopeptidase [Anaerolineales bacterium]|nr:LysM peptidoglycan-binding domain-containing M23 family metallopeptidase [Anaerolineales bacterium]
MAKLSAFLKKNRFSVISWAVTLLLVAGMIFGALQWRDSTSVPQAMAPIATTGPNSESPQVPMPALGGGPGVFAAIEREILLKTNIPADKPRYEPADYRVMRGDSIFAIADAFKLKPETVYWANHKVFNGSPTNIQPGQELVIPPTDGVYYEWQEGDTIESVTDKFEIKPDDIIYWPGNGLDLTNPTVESGTFVMIPGAVQDDQPLFIEVATSASSGGSSGCEGGYQSQGYFIWPTSARYLSGYDFGQDGHNGIDISAPEGVPIYAADNGVVTMAQGGWNYGYGNVVQIDHGNGFVTIYAHLSVISVGMCQSITAGAPIGAAGNTGNSQGAHLHFEIRQNGTPVNPWLLLQ